MAGFFGEFWRGRLGSLESQDFLGFLKVILAIPGSRNRQKKDMLRTLRLGLRAHHQLQFVQLGRVEDARCIEHDVAA